MSKYFLRSLAVVALITYIGIEYLHWLSVETISPYAIYIFEFIWSILCLAAFRRTPFYSKPCALTALLVGVLFPLGWAVHAFAKVRGFVVPFDFANSETILFLLLIGPVLEEIIYRAAFWRIFESLFVKPVLIILFTSIAFSYSHFHSSLFVPEEFKAFIYYQTAYTFVLALVCGNLRLKHGLVFSILGHALFNFGFWVGR